MTAITPTYLKRFNLIAAGLHLVQGLAVAALASGFTLPVSVGFLSFNTANQSLESATHTLIDLPLAWLIVLFFMLSAGFHFIIATEYFDTYMSNLKKGINKARWFEYSLSASVMMVAIAMLVGIYDLGALIMIFALTAVMNLMGLMMEIHNQSTKKTNWLSYNIGILAGAVPWLVVLISFWAASAYGAGDIPTFVYWIYVSIFLFFNCFAINMYLQYKKIGKWSDYLYGERAYIILSLVAKSLLAWQVFAGTLQPA